MKKSLLLFVGMFCCNFISFGQAGIGLKAGFRSSRTVEKVNYFGTTEVEKSNSILVPTFGLVAEFGTEKMVAFQMEINSNSRGSRDVIGNYELISRYNAIEIPLLLKVNIGEGDIRGFVNVGPYFAYNYSGEYTEIEDGKVLPVDTAFVYEVGEFVEEDIDFGFKFGAGAKYKLGPGKLFAEIRYSYGINAKLVDYSYNYRTIGFTIGYIFDNQ